MSISGTSCLFLLILISVSFGQRYRIEDFIPPTKINQAHLRPLLNTLKSAHFFQAESSFLTQKRRVEAANPEIYPTDFGADPTGKADSTNAFLAAMKVLLSRTSNHSMADNIIDLGGATLDLGGGVYIISQPLIIPSGYGNVRIVRGTLRASPSFPKSDYLIMVGSNACNNGQGSCNENIGFEELMLDSSVVAAGGILITKTMGANVGPQMFFHGFTVAGITVAGGHETMIHETWLGQYYYSDPRRRDSSADGIQLLGNDHFVTNTIVFAAKIGVYMTGEANLLVGVHTWNLAESLGGIGMYVNCPGYTQNRILASYLDYNSVVAVAPEHLSIVDCFFLCGANIVLKAIPNYTTINGLNIIGNEWDSCGNETIVLDERQAKFTAVYDTVVENNMVKGMTPRSTRATGRLSLSNTSYFEFDFSKRLLFPTIQSVSYSIQLSGNSFARHASRPPQGLKVVVETDVPVSGTVTIQVDQSQPSQPCAATC